MVHIRRYKGDTLIEILISLLVLSFGAVGAAAMQINSVKTVHHSYHATTATFLVRDMAERIRANTAIAQADTYNCEGNTTSNNCTAFLALLV